MRRKFASHWVFSRESDRIDAEDKIQPQIPDEDGFVRLLRGNSWGASYFSTSPYTNSGQCDSRRKQHPPAGSMLTVRFDNGNLQRCLVLYKTVTDRVSAMGKQGDVQSEIPCIQVIVHGHSVMIELDQVDVKADELPPLESNDG